MDILAHRVQTFDRDDLHKYNVSVLQQLTDVALVQCYQKHTVRSAEFLKKISEEPERVRKGPRAVLQPGSLS
eukprot:4785938-Amphidinium_carterae.1